MRRTDDRSRESRDSRDYFNEDRVRDLERKRREWRIEQEKRREHEKRKQKMIEEWEMKRAKELELKKQRRRSKSRSRSASPGPSKRRGRSRSVESRRRPPITKVPVMSEKCDSSSTSNTPLFKGSEGSNISLSELKKIKVNIQRDISNAEETSELLRDITSLDEIVLKRREGEGSKPIFEREELKQNDSSADKVLERRTVVTVDEIETDKKTSSKRRSRSSSSGRHRSPSSRRPSSGMGHPTWITIPLNIDLYFSLGEGSKPIFEREELKTEKNTTVNVPERRTVVAVDKIATDEKHPSERRSRSLSSGRYPSRSSRRGSRHDAVSKLYTENHRKINSHDRGDRPTDDRYHVSRKSTQERVRDFRSHRSHERERELRTGSHRDSGYREHHDYESLAHHRRSAAALSYAKSMAFPVYYDNLVRPIMVDPMMMLRAPLPVMRGRIPPIMTPFRPPYRPQFMPPEMFRFNAPPNQGYGRVFPRNGMQHAPDSSFRREF